ncbi:hypothetical protein [Alicyclobacillus sacchari]|uniref:hypothetical protein n=1 Tax=Alicyclobacillus sacchari TaxID=392010 RepID=UPI0024E15EF8|nr:hypothetical protein [Alicyclobacillus sacchari]
MFFRKCMARLGEANIPVYFIRGNHDAASLITRELRLPDNVFEFSVSEPETKFLEDIGVAIHGQGFAMRDVRENLARSYPARPRLFQYRALAHSCARASLPRSVRPLSHRRSPPQGL